MKGIGSGEPMVCPLCQGEKWLANEPCPECDGTGEVESDSFFDGADRLYEDDKDK